ncbi:MAG: hypothetical protein FJ100_24155, partial [Deltaproteobacteria bacterium]|nr:hypothetical protein [Deltaproteobacteria bacterium]
QQARDRSQVEALMDAGFPQVLRFHHAGDWRSVLLAYPSVFGSGWKQRQEA